MDPSSIILLYNGGPDPTLLKNHAFYKEFGVIIHPSPTPQQHGYLHGFCLDCMDYALTNFTFDTFTIVDSDQLAIRPGYSAFLGNFFAGKTKIGLLSSKPEPIVSEHTNNHIAKQAFLEIDLWKPLFDSLSKGRDHFVHWTFWPSTVFSIDAVKALSQLFKSNDLLKEILCKTKIWATEEVIFPTLVKLLGFDVAANPCSHDYVQYCKDYDQSLIPNAYKKMMFFGFIRYSGYTPILFASL